MDLEDAPAAAEHQADNGGPAPAVGQPPPAPTSRPSPFTGPTAQLLDKLRDQVSQYLLTNEAYVGAGISAGRYKPDTDAVHMFTSLDMLVQGLFNLGFELNADCTWRRLGIPCMEGCRPELQLIAARAKLADDLLALTADTPWGRDPAKASVVAKHRTDVAMAASGCEDSLQEVLRDRKAAGLDRRGWNTWLEAEQELTDWLHGFMPPGTIQMTQLSNISNQALDPRISPPIASRLVLDKLLGPAAGALEAFNSLQSPGLVCWSPDSKEDVARLVQNYRRYLATGALGGSFRLGVLLRFEPVASATSASLLLDLWSHPLLEHKIQDIVTNTTVLRQPSRVVVTRATGPATTLQTLVLVQLGVPDAQAVPTAISWRSQMEAGENQSFVLVDVERSAAATTRRSLEQAALPLISAWDGPLPSPGSNSQHQRVLFRGYVQDMSTATERLLVQQVRDIGLPTSALVGSSALWEDGGAFVADLTTPAVVTLMHRDVDSGLFLSPTTLLFQPAGDLQSWQRLVSELAEQDAARCVTMVRWRRSRNAGRPWVRPQMLQEDLRNRTAAAKSMATGRGGSDTAAARTVLLSLSGGTLGSDPAAVRTATLRKIEEHLGRQLVLAAGGTALKEGLWSATSPSGPDWDGRMRIHLSTEDEVRKLHSDLHGLPVWTGVSWCHLAITNAQLDSWNAPRLQQGGGAVRRGGRPARQ